MSEATSDKPQCARCNDTGRVMISLSEFGLGKGFEAFMAAGCENVYREDGNHQCVIACPRCR